MVTPCWLVSNDVFYLPAPTIPPSFSLTASSSIASCSTKASPSRICPDTQLWTTGNTAIGKKERHVRFVRSKNEKWPGCC